MQRTASQIDAARLNNDSLVGLDDKSPDRSRQTLGHVSAQPGQIVLHDKDRRSGPPNDLGKQSSQRFGTTCRDSDRNGSIRAYMLENGKELWRTKTKAPLSAGPGVGEGLVLVGTSEGELLAFSLEDGVEQWRVPVSSEVLSVPKIHEGIVVVQTVDGDITGLNADTGERLWVHDWSVPVSPPARSLTVSVHVPSAGSP